MHRPRHRRPEPAVPVAGIALTAMAAAAVALPLAAQHSAAQPVRLDPKTADVADTAAAHIRQAGPVHARLSGRLLSYTVQRGDYLSEISAKLCGTAGGYRALALNNGIRDPDMIQPGDVIQAACHAAASALARAYPAPEPAVQAPATVTAGARPEAHAAAREAAVSVSGGYGCSALEALWEEAGGNPGSAETAASVAMAESGGNPNAFSPTDDRGLWQINAGNGALSTFSPSGSARSAVVLSDDGTNWSPWTTYTSGAYRGRC
jgi:Lysozyme like domain/LysM domain